MAQKQRKLSLEFDGFHTAICTPDDHQRRGAKTFFKLGQLVVGEGGDSLLDGTVERPVLAAAAAAALAGDLLVLLAEKAKPGQGLGELFLAQEPLGQVVVK